MMVMVLAGGILGFCVAAVGLLAGLSPLAALAIWAGSGPAAAALAVALAALPDRRDAARRPSPGIAPTARHA